MNDLRERCMNDARLCRDSAECPVNHGRYCMFGPGEECSDIAADYLDMAATLGAMSAISMTIPMFDTTGGE